MHSICLEDLLIFLLKYQILCTAIKGTTKTQTEHSSAKRADSMLWGMKRTLC